MWDFQHEFSGHHYLRLSEVNALIAIAICRPVFNFCIFISAVEESNASDQKQIRILLFTVCACNSLVLS